MRECLIKGAWTRPVRREDHRGEGRWHSSEALEHVRQLIQANRDQHECDIGGKCFHHVVVIQLPAVASAASAQIQPVHFKQRVPGGGRSGAHQVSHRATLFPQQRCVDGADDAGAHNRHRGLPALAWPSGWLLSLHLAPFILPQAWSSDVLVGDTAGRGSSFAGSWRPVCRTVGRPEPCLGGSGSRGGWEADGREHPQGPVPSGAVVGYLWVFPGCRGQLDPGAPLLPVEQVGL